MQEDFSNAGKKFLMVLKAKYFQQDKINKEKDSIY